MSKKFQKSIIDHCRYAVDAMMSCSNEQAVKNYLIEPFLLLLGYDTRRPGIVLPELRVTGPNGESGRVDYAIRTDDDYYIAIECKPLSSKLRDEQGQLRRYFDDMDKVAIGRLTNAIRYIFFTNVDIQHRMDAEPFAAIDLKAIAENGISDVDYQVLSSLRKDHFDRDGLREIAKLQLIQKRLQLWWLNQLTHPSEELCRLALKEQGFGRVTQKMVDSLRQTIIQGFIEALAHNVHEKLSGKSSRRGFNIYSPHKGDVDPRIVTTEREIEIYNYCKTKLAHHTNSVVPFELIQEIEKKDRIEKFSIYFRQVNNGRILDFYELAGGQERFEFPNGAVYDNLSDIDDALVSTFLQRIKQYGEALE
jgi:hypothetical protein